MIDFAKITVCAGDGGGGAATWRHLKGKRYGKADGGIGGDGGNVYFEATRDVNTLEKFRFIKKYESQNGTSGFSNLRRGATGEDLVVKVPIGTQIRISNSAKQNFSFKFPISNSKVRHSRESGNQSEKILDQVENDNNDQVFDLIEDGDRILVARGGRGGRGNAYLRDEFGRRPRSAERGEEGEFKRLTLELKLIADVGLIGLPNAGKSSLLAALTAAKPEIANYPFTTLEPNLGVLQEAYSEGQRIAYSDYEKKIKLDARLLNAKRLVIADIPGLIEGASRGKGLGDLFLRHIERTGVLVHLVDLSNLGHLSNLSFLWNSYQTVRNELRTYSKDLAKKKEIIVLSKIDLADKQTVSAATREFAKHRKKALAISVKTGEGIEQLVRRLEGFVY